MLIKNVFVRKIVHRKFALYEEITLNLKITNIYKSHSLLSHFFAKNFERTKF